MYTKTQYTAQHKDRQILSQPVIQASQIGTVRGGWICVREQQGQGEGGFGDGGGLYNVGDGGGLYNVGDGGGLHNDGDGCGLHNVGDGGGLKFCSDVSFSDNILN